QINLNIESRDYTNLIQYLTELELPEGYTKRQNQMLKNQSRYYIIREGMLYQKNHREPNQPLRILKRDEVRIMLKALYNDSTSSYLGERAIIEKVTQPFNRVGMDIVGPLPLTRNSNRYLVVAIEYLTKCCLRQILTDQETHFKNKIIKEACNKANIKYKFSSMYHPQTNGLVKQFNRTICEALAKCISQYQGN
ncbi:8241_t:CDS:2, partial [Cetraspora pellucida]